MKIVTIDPGKTGGLAFGDERTIHEIYVMPEDIGQTIALIKKHSPVLCWLEASQPMPKQGVRSVFTYGQHFGELIGALRGLLIPIRMIRPTVWTKEIHRGYSGSDPKAKSKTAAFNLYPHLNFLASDRSRKSHEGLIDAVCLYEYAKREIRNEN